jgi:CubicO group peptidase (beta-lactamase class C family)
LYGSAIDWASKLLTAVTGTSLGQYMEEHIFKPLGMNDTSFRPTHSTARACFTRQPDKQIRYDLAPVPAQPPVESGGAGLYTTAADHGKFLAALLKASSGNNNDTRVRLLKKETVDVMFRPQLDPVQHTMFEAAMRQSRESLCPWAGMDVVDQLQHGIGGVINLADVPKKRRQGSMSWVAMNNCHWVSSLLGLGPKPSESASRPHCISNL